MLNLSRICLVGNFEEVHVGAYFFSSAKKLGLQIDKIHSAEAFQAGFFKRKFSWYLGGRCPPLLASFSKKAVREIQVNRPDLVVTTGIAPLDTEALRAIKSFGCKLANYSTDDPLGGNGGPWFLEGLYLYDAIFSCRKANLDELRNLGCSQVEYLPFGYASETHYVCDSFLEGDREKYACDVLFIGGADRDRIPFFEDIVNQGYKVHLYGAHWDRYPKLRKSFKGFANAEICRKAVYYSKVCLGLVREANRDDNSMRTYEIPAMRGCFLLQDTEAHRDLFGRDGESVAYFKSIGEMKTKLQELLSDSERRRYLAEAAYRRITQGGNTYFDRFQAIIKKMRVAE